MNKQDEQVNEAITAKELLVITNSGEQLGIMSKSEALKAAYDRDLDLVVVAAQAKPPVAKILDYSKHKFDQQKKGKDMRKNQKIVQTKEIRLSATIQKHDLETKARAAKKFLESGEKVKVSIRFGGRMITHSELGRPIMNEFISMIGEVALIETYPKMDGRILFMVLTPNIEKKEI